LKDGFVEIVVSDDRLHLGMEFFQEGVGDLPPSIHDASGIIESSVDEIPSPDDQVRLEGVHQLRCLFKSLRGALLLPGMAIREKTETQWSKIG
jgi:hypothetical protein